MNLIMELKRMKARQMAEDVDKEMMNNYAKNLDQEIMNNYSKDIMKKNEEIIFPIRMETIPIVPRERKLRPGWKSWVCPKCFEHYLYIGKRPKHSKCPGKFQIINMMSKESEQELIDCMAKEIKKEIKKEINKNESRIDVNHTRSRKTNRGCRKNMLSK